MIQLPFSGSVLSKKCCMVTNVTMQLVGLVKFVSSDKYHSFGGIPWGIPNPASIPSTFFLHRRTAPAWAWLSMGERCVPIKFIRSACLPSKTRRVETWNFLIFSRTTTTSLLTSYLWGFRGIGVARSWMNVRWVVVVVVVVVLFLGNVPWVTRIMSSWNQGCSFHQCWLPFVSRVACHSRHIEHPLLVTNELRMCFE